MIRPPAHIAPFVEVLGEEGAVAFLLEFGGAKLYLSQNPGRKSRLVRLVGRDRAIALARRCEDLPARIPTGKPWIARHLKSKSLSGAEIARRLHVTDVTVRSYLKGADPDAAPDPRQPGLPFD